MLKAISSDDYYKKHFIPWQTEAKYQWAEFKANDDIEGFKAWLRKNRNAF